MNLRKIIREQLENVINQEINDLDIPELNDFNFIKKNFDDNLNKLWKYTLQEENYTINLFVSETKGGKWYYKIFVYWKSLSKGMTNGRGKDFELQFGPFNNLEDLKKDLKHSLEHNVLFSFKNYHDNNKTQLNDEIFNLIPILVKNKEDIENNTDDFFKDLREILPNLLKSKDEVVDFLNKEYPDEEDKQFLTLLIQKANKIQLHKQINSIKSLF